MVKTSPTAPLVKRLVPSSLSLPTTLTSPGKITLCRLVQCAGKRSALTWPPLIRLWPELDLRGSVEGDVRRGLHEQRRHFDWHP